MSLDLLGAPARFTDRAHGQPMQMASNDCGNSPISIDLAKGIRHTGRVVTSPFFTAEVLFTGGWLACLACPKTNNAPQTGNVTCPAHRALFLLPKPQAEANLFFSPPRSQTKTKQASKKAISSFSTHRDEEGWGLSSYAGAPPFDTACLVGWLGSYPCLVSFADTWTFGPLDP